MTELLQLDNDGNNGHDGSIIHNNNSSSSSVSSKVIDEIEEASMLKEEETSDISMEAVVVNDNNHNNNNDNKEGALLQGILFRRSIRASYASCDLVVLSENEEEEEHVVVLIQFAENTATGTKTKDEMTNIRSYLRRFLQLGHVLYFNTGNWLLSTNNNYNKNVDKNVDKTRIRRFEIALCSSSIIDDNIEEQHKQSIVEMNPIRSWNVSQCQKARCQYYPKWEMNPNHLRPHNKNNNKNNTANNNTDNTNSSNTNKEMSIKKRKQKACQGQTGHGGGIGKRQQGQVIAAFLIQLFTTTLPHHDNNNKDEIPTFLASTDDDDDDKKKKAIDALSQGAGVLDIAGGSGHVSMAFSLKGIPSTVIDPRSNVGRLPGRDRKIYKRALQQQQPPSAKIITPYSTFRAWFGNKPNGVDLEFRQQQPQKNNNEQEKEIPILCCQPCSPDNDATTTSNNDLIVQHASAIVALHPDEATESIVDVCVQYRKPFVIVPCCVFSRLFPNRLKPFKGSTTTSTKREYVTTYTDFIDYLCAKHSSIQKTQLLNFDGANLALWSTFPPATTSPTIITNTTT